MESIIAVIYGPPLAILVSAVSLLNVQLVTQWLSTFVKGKGGSAAWKAVKPALKNVSGILDSAFGAKFEPTAQHVLLLALLLATLFSAERVVGALRSNAAAAKVTTGRVEKALPSAPSTPDSARKTK